MSLRTPPLNITHEISFITHYIKDIATFHTFTINEPQNMRPYFATEYTSEAVLLNIMQSLTEDYQHYVCNRKYRAHTAKKERKAIDSCINRHDAQAFLEKRYDNTIARPNQ